MNRKTSMDTLGVFARNNRAGNISTDGESWEEAAELQLHAATVTDVFAFDLILKIDANRFSLIL